MCLDWQNAATDTAPAAGVCSTASHHLLGQQQTAGGRRSPLHSYLAASSRVKVSLRLEVKLLSEEVKKLSELREKKFRDLLFNAMVVSPALFMSARNSSGRAGRVSISFWGLDRSDGEGSNPLVPQKCIWLQHLAGRVHLNTSVGRPANLSRLHLFDTAVTEGLDRARLKKGASL